MANAQTRATKKYQAKMGIIRKSFTTHQTTADQFKKASKVSLLIKQQLTNSRKLVRSLVYPKTLR